MSGSASSTAPPEEAGLNPQFVQQRAECVKDARAFEAATESVSFAQLPPDTVAQHKTLASRAERFQVPSAKLAQFRDHLVTVAQQTKLKLEKAREAATQAIAKAKQAEAGATIAGPPATSLPPAPQGVGLAPDFQKPTADDSSSSSDTPPPLPAKAVASPKPLAPGGGKRSRRSAKHDVAPSLCKRSPKKKRGRPEVDKVRTRRRVLSPSSASRSRCTLRSPQQRRAHDRHRRRRHASPEVFSAPGADLVTRAVRELAALSLENRELKAEVTDLEDSLQAERSARVGTARLLNALALARQISQHATLACDAAVDLQGRTQDVENATSAMRRAAQTLATAATEPASLGLLRPGLPPDEFDAFRALLADLTEPPLPTQAPQPHSSQTGDTWWKSGNGGWGSGRQKQQHGGGKGGKRK